MRSIDNANSSAAAWSGPRMEFASGMIVKAAVIGVQISGSDSISASAGGGSRNSEQDALNGSARRDATPAHRKASPWPVWATA